MPNDGKDDGGMSGGKWGGRGGASSPFVAEKKERSNYWGRKEKSFARRRAAHTGGIGTAGFNWVESASSSKFSGDLRHTVYCARHTHTHTDCEMRVAHHCREYEHTLLYHWQWHSARETMISRQNDDTNMLLHWLHLHGVPSAIGKRNETEKKSENTFHHIGDILWIICYVLLAHFIQKRQKKMSMLLNMSWESGLGVEQAFPCPPAPRIVSGAQENVVLEGETKNERRKKVESWRLSIANEDWFSKIE